jgi:hypothetical protein
MGQQGRKTQQKRETAGRSGKTSNLKPQKRHQKSKQIHMGKGELSRLWDASDLL